MQVKKTLRKNLSEVDLNSEKIQCNPKMIFIFTILEQHSQFNFSYTCADNTREYTYIDILQYKSIQYTILNGIEWIIDNLQGINTNSKIIVYFEFEDQYQIFLNCIKGRFHSKTERDLWNRLILEEDLFIHIFFDVYEPRKFKKLFKNHSYLKGGDKSIKIRDFINKKK